MLRHARITVVVLAGMLTTGFGESLLVSSDWHLRLLSSTSPYVDKQAPISLIVSMAQLLARSSRQATSGTINMSGN